MSNNMISVNPTVWQHMGHLHDILHKADTEYGLLWLKYRQPTTLKVVWRQVCSTRKRPYIWAETQIDGTVYVCTPKLKKLKGVLTYWSLLNTTPGVNVAYRKTVVDTCIHPGADYIWFQFLEAIETQNHLRAELKLPLVAQALDQAA